MCNATNFICLQFYSLFYFIVNVDYSVSWNAHFIALVIFFLNQGLNVYCCKYLIFKCHIWNFVTQELSDLLEFIKFLKGYME